MKYSGLFASYFAGKKRLVFVRRLALAALLWLAAGQSFASDAAGETHWLCWYNKVETIYCELLTASPTITIEPNVVPTGPRPLPPIVAQLLTAPETLANRRIAIPLFSYATDMERVEQLAEAVMCGIKSRCQVHFGSAAELALMADARDDIALSEIN